jgi:hypothetical protein
LGGGYQTERPTLAWQCEVLFTDDPAIKNPDPAQRSVLARDRIEDLLQRGDICPVAFKDFVEQGKASSVTTMPE